MIKTYSQHLISHVNEGLNLDSKLHFHPEGSMGFSNNEYALEFDKSNVYYWNKITGNKIKYSLPDEKMGLFIRMYKSAKQEAISHGRTIHYLGEVHYVINGDRADELISEFEDYFF
ncbi:MAG: hypothetical protein WC376_05270 [Candidatus Nanoarchaeia archaeon]|jgi:hypothetical protein